MFGVKFFIRLLKPSSSIQCSCHGQTRKRWPWTLVSGVAVWYIWKWRDKEIFKKDSSPNSTPIAAISSLVVDTMLATTKLMITAWKSLNKTILLARNTLQSNGCNWMLMDAAKRQSGFVGQRFHHKIRFSNSVKAELWVVITGLELLGLWVFGSWFLNQTLHLPLISLQRMEWKLMRTADSSPALVDR